MEQIFLERMCWVLARVEVEAEPQWHLKMQRLVQLEIMFGMAIGGCAVLF